VVSQRGFCRNISNLVGNNRTVTRPRNADNPEMLPKLFRQLDLAAHATRPHTAERPVGFQNGAKMADLVIADSGLYCAGRRDGQAR
jgi:hypothetical protein